MQATPRPTAVPLPDAVGRTLSAPASWYCGNGSACTVGYPASCLCAAAGPALRVGNWRGRWVTVTTSRASVRLRLIDTCGCPGGRALDLYGQVFAQLAPHGLSDGIVSVRISW